MLRHLLAAAGLSAAFAPLASAQWVVAGYNDFLGVDDGEFTPDGRYFVLRDNTAATQVQVIDTTTGARVFTYMPTSGPMGGVCQDAVAVSNERAVVIGTRALVVDLNNLVLLQEHDLGIDPRDVVMTPDGTFAAIRGGDGLYILEMATGTIVATGNGLPAEYLGSQGFDVDSVVADDHYAVFTSETGSGTKYTRVTAFDLHPAGGGPPAVVFQTDSTTRQEGRAHDIAMTPDGRYAAVRSDMEVGLYRLDGALTTQVWKMRLKNDPGPFSGSALDSIEVTNKRVATISRVATGGAQLDVFTPNGLHKYASLLGDPHDLALTPNSDLLAVRTHEEVTLWDLRNLPAGDVLTPLDVDTFPGSWTSWSAGLDSIVATDRYVAAMSRVGSDTRVRIYDIAADQLGIWFNAYQTDKALDLAFSPDGGKIIFGFWKSYLVVDARTGQILLDKNGSPKTGAPTWCDGVAIDGRHAAAFGVGIPNDVSGWLRLIDLFEDPVRYCTANPNSTGAAAHLIVAGSPDTGQNDLSLWAVDAPQNEFGRFFYGDQMVSVPYGDGFTCVGGQVARFGVAQTSSAGVISTVVDVNNLPPNGGVIVPGSTWNFQLVYRDTGSSTSTFNLSDALSVTFE